MTEHYCQDCGDDQCVRCIVADRDAALVRVAELDGVIAADDARLRSAAERVWGEHMWGCDTTEHMADLVLALRDRVAELETASLYCDVCASELQREACNHVRACVTCATAERAESEDRLLATLRPFGVRFMDPPDGGSVTLIEQVERMGVALAESEAQLEANALNHDVEAAGLKADLAATTRELERWRHGVPLEGDFICPDTLRLRDLTIQITKE